MERLEDLVFSQIKILNQVMVYNCKDNNCYYTKIIPLYTKCKRQNPIIITTHIIPFSVRTYASFI